MKRWMICLLSGLLLVGQGHDRADVLLRHNTDRIGMRVAVPGAVAEAGSPGDQSGHLFTQGVVSCRG